MNARGTSGQVSPASPAASTNIGKVIPPDTAAIHWDVGVIIPNFTFTDQNGQHRQLTDYRGKYVLLEFWGSWCQGCVPEISYLKTAYTKCRVRGFEIIGMEYEDVTLGPGVPDSVMADFRKGLYERARKLLSDSAIVWPQASTAAAQRSDESAKVLIERFSVPAWPTLILLDPEGRVVANTRDRASSGLVGDRLLETLERILPPPHPIK